MDLEAISNAENARKVQPVLSQDDSNDSNLPKQHTGEDATSIIDHKDINAAAVDAELNKEKMREGSSEWKISGRQSSLSRRFR